MVKNEAIEKALDTYAASFKPADLPACLPAARAELARLLARVAELEADKARADKEREAADGLLHQAECLAHEAIPTPRNRNKLPVTIGMVKSACAAYRAAREVQP